MYEALVAYRQAFGHCRVRSTGKSGLAKWVEKQRLAKEKGKLSAERVRRLDELGFSWRVKHEAKWEAKYDALAAYWESHGNFRVPSLEMEHADLAHWVAVQRHKRRIGKLSAERVRRLDELGFPWEAQRRRPATWEAMYEALAAFRKAFGDCEVPGKGPPGLAKWVAAQRLAKRKGKLSEVQVRRLDKLGFLWELREGQWEKMFAALVEYRTAYGDCDVPGGQRPVSELAAWVHAQRVRTALGTLPSRQKERLEAVGFRFTDHTGPCPGPRR